MATRTATGKPLLRLSPGELPTAIAVIGVRTNHLASGMANTIGVDKTRALFEAAIPLRQAQHHPQSAVATMKSGRSLGGISSPGSPVFPYPALAAIHSSPRSLSQASQSFTA